MTTTAKAGFDLRDTRKLNEWLRDNLPFWAKVGARHVTRDFRQVTVFSVTGTNLWAYADLFQTAFCVKSVEAGRTSNVLYLNY